MMSATTAGTDRSGSGRRAWRFDGRLAARTRGFFSWWRVSLAAWLPLRLRELFGLAQRRLVLASGEDSYAVQVHDDGGLRELARLPAAVFTGAEGDPLDSLLQGGAGDLPRWLLLPARLGLRRPLVLPEAAAGRLHEVLGFEIDRQTPFTAAEVHHACRILGRRGDGRIDVELVVVPRAVIAAQLAALGPVAPGLAGIDLDSAQGPLGVDLLEDSARGRRGDPQRRTRWLLAGIALMLVAFGMWQVRANRTAAAAALEAEVAAAATHARAASAQRQQLTDLREGMAFLDAQRAARPLAIAALDDIARRLPDGTSLEKAAIEGDRVLLIGLSTEASALVGQLSGSSLLQAPALAGALQNDPRSRADRFTLTATLVPPAAKAPAATQERTRADDDR